MKEENVLELTNLECIKFTFKTCLSTWKKTGFKFKVDCVLLNKDSYSFASEKTVLFWFFLSFLVLQ